ncbi:MAG: VOC family protein [Thermoleophilaceae bacterium]|nr:VOC family protein [Thermoleophilaceae bacterium]
MAERTEHAPGTFSWVELLTSDAAAAKEFYAQLLGWTYDDLPLSGGGAYTMVLKDGKRVAGLHQPSPENAAPPNWLSYVTVEDADAAAARAGELGATTLAGPFEVESAGRMAVLQDSQGAVFAVWQPRGSIGAELVNDPGSLTLNQLNARDVDAARGFYSSLFGWRIETANEDPPYWGIYNGDTLNGGLMELPPGGGAPPHWLAYFTVEDMAAANAGITEHGGSILVPPMQIQSGQILVAADPQGPVFALFEGPIDP